MSAIAVAAGEASGVLANAIASGNRDVNQLTNIVFFSRHPELAGRKLRSDERDLAKEWLMIRETIVRPALRTGGAPTPPAPSAPSAAPARPPIPASRLDWPGATDVQLAFMRAVYERHYQRALRGKRPYVADLPDAALDTIEGRHRARTDAARTARELLAAARADLAAEGLAGKVELGIVSAYRPAAHQFVIWQGKGRSGGFPHYYAVTQSARRRLGDEHGPQAVEYLTRVIAKKIAAPGFSDHQDGLAIDFATSGPGGRDIGKIGEKAWFFRWLKANGARFGFEPYPEEPWHWTFRGSAGAVQQETAGETSVGVRAGRLEVARVPLLARHRGQGPALVLRWNDMPSRPEEIDVVVHLHGYSRAGMTLPRDIERWSGLDLAPVDGAPGQGRSRPTLTVLPRGHFTGEQSGKLYKYRFPALITKGAVPELVRFALERFASTVGGTTPRVGRLLLTAHSGGGAPLLRILRDLDPHEVHVFDGLYQHAGPLARWARRHIADRRNGGALRVFYRGGTRKFSRQLFDELAGHLAAAPEDVRRRYRAEASTYGHWQIARQYGWRVLADPGADVPNARREAAGARELEVESEAFLTTLPFVSSIQDALRQKLWPVAVTVAIAAGNRDENKLTNMVFSARHPELQGRKLRPDERALAKEWLDIREKLIRPAIKAAPTPAARSAAPGGSPAPPLCDTQLERDRAECIPLDRRWAMYRGQTQRPHRPYSYFLTRSEYERYLNTFSFIKEKMPRRYSEAVQAFEAYRAVWPEMAYHIQLQNAASYAALVLTSSGVALEVERRSILATLTDIGQQTITDQVAEHLTRFIFGADLWTVFGLALQFADVLKQIEAENLLKMKGAAGEEARFKKKLSLVLDIVAADRARKEGRDRFEVKIRLWNRYWELERIKGRYFEFNALERSLDPFLSLAPREPPRIGPARQ
jgi:LAS superfamily LD-carboxypeptidase LdcB